MNNKNGSKGSSEVGNTNTTSRRISNALNWCFTYNNYDAEDIKGLISVFEEKGINFVFQEETGEEKQTKHLQGYIRFPSKSRPSSLKLSKKIHWEICRDVEASIKYCSKKETRTGSIFANIPFPKPLKILEESKFYKWQVNIVKKINKHRNDEINDRIIHWYYSKEGGKGKSTFSKYLCYKYKALILCGKASDMKYGIIKYHENNGFYPDIIILDVPRENFEYLSYTGIEEVKNGCFFSQKYESSMALFNSPLIIVFCNYEPNYNAMSKDRWKVICLD